jgi:hypothetical protein
MTGIEREDDVRVGEKIQSRQGDCYCTPSTAVLVCHSRTRVSSSFFWELLIGKPVIDDLHVGNLGR